MNDKCRVHVVGIIGCDPHCNDDNNGAAKESLSWFPFVYKEEIIVSGGDTILFLRLHSDTFFQELSSNSSSDSNVR